MPSPAVCFNHRICQFDELPSIIGIESFVGCNIKCKMCHLPSVFGKTLPAQKIDPGLFRKIIDGCAGGVRTVILGGRGEPLLNPDLPELVELAAKHHHLPGFYCNGTLMTEEKAHQLLKAGLKWIFFSVDGITAETFEKLRVGAKFDMVMNNVLQMARINKTVYGGKCAVMINCTLSSDTLPERTMIIEFWKKHGIALRFTPLIGYEYTHGFTMPRDMGARGNERGVLLKKKGKRYPCNILWMRCNVTVEGKYLCCYYEEPFRNLPSIGDVGMKEFWRIHLGKLRGQHVNGEIACAECASCNWWIERSKHISFFERQRIEFVNRGYVKMDRLMKIWDFFTGYKPIMAT